MPQSSSVDLERQLKRFVRQIRPGLIGATKNPNANLAQVIEELKSNTEMAQSTAEAFGQLLGSREFTGALTETGLTLESGVFSELFKRLEYKLIPKPVDDLDILSFCSNIFDSKNDVEWLESIDREQFAEFLALILPAREKLIERLSPQLFMALEILSLRLAGMGYDPVVSQRLKMRKEYQHAFMDVTRHVHGLLDGKGEEALGPLKESLNRCLHAVRFIRSRRSQDGASLALTYRLMKIDQTVGRMQGILDVIQAVLGEWDSRPATDLFFEVLLADVGRFDVRRFVLKNVEVLAFQITEHTGKAGEHYITKTRSEWRGMFRSAALGGAVVACLAIVKNFVVQLHLPPIPDFFATGFIYAGGFVLIHSIGGALATKQPAMTASTLASALDEARDSHQAMDNLSEIIICTIRSQFIAVLGNFLVAFPVAVILTLPFMSIGWPVMHVDKAHLVIQSLHPFKSLSFVYAAIAGVWLFVSGLLAGMADNWFVFNHVGSRLKRSERLSRLVGPHKVDPTVRLIDDNLGFWVGNITLGFFLAAMPALGRATGLPLDIRHITFATASFGVALTSLHFSILPSLAFLTTFSILMMGLINLAVSFSLSLLVAVKSRRIRFAQTPELIAILGQKLADRPFEFFVPAKDSK